ncbi:DUF3151 family protein [Rhodococcus hoagii]|nr:DUF3151 family protein [Prescottella equi]
MGNADARRRRDVRRCARSARRRAGNEAASRDQVLRLPADRCPRAGPGSGRTRRFSPMACAAFARTATQRRKPRLGSWLPTATSPIAVFLRCVAVLAKAAQAIGENDEYARCLDLLEDSDPRAAEALGLG